MCHPEIIMGVPIKAVKSQETVSSMWSLGPQSNTVQSSLERGRDLISKLIRACPPASAHASVSTPETELFST